MLVELHVNGKLELQLTPETDIERAFISTMFVAADKGVALKMSMLPDSGTGYAICAEVK